MKQPELYLRGISTNFPEALQALLGEQAEGLSATNIVRMKQVCKNINPGKAGVLKESGMFTSGLMGFISISG